VLRVVRSFATSIAARISVPRRPVSAGPGVDRPVLTTPTSLPPDRRGRLKNGNPAGDFLAAPRCGARTRCGGECRQPAMPNGRCRLHGGLSTGPRTAAARSRRARLTHGARSAGVRALLREARAHARRTLTLRARLTGFSAGHGVHRSFSGAASLAPMAKVSQREHPPSAHEARTTACSVHPRSCVAEPSPAGHGVHRSVLKLLPPDGARPA
jgi:hypothetical protein